MKKLLSIVLALVMALSLCVTTTWAAENTVDVTTVEGLANAIASSQSATSTVINIKNDLDFGSVTWNSDIAHGDMVIDGGTGVTLKNLSSMFIKENKGGQTVTIKNVTIDGASISAGELGVAAFIGYADNTGSLTFENCKLTNSQVTNTSAYAGGFVGYATGGAPIYRTITFTNCQVLNCTITGANSTGGLMGHAIGNDNLSVVVNNSTVKENTITCTDDSNVKAGSLFGTASTAASGATITVSADTGDNIVKSNGAEVTTIYGRQVNDGTTLTLTGGSYDKEPLGTNDSAWAKTPADLPVAKVTDTDGNTTINYGDTSIKAAATVGATVEVTSGSVTMDDGTELTPNSEPYVVPQPAPEPDPAPAPAPSMPDQTPINRQDTTVTTPATKADDTTKTDTVTSAKTFDAGVAVYAVMGVMSLTGSAWVVGKKRV